MKRCTAKELTGALAEAESLFVYEKLDQSMVSCQVAFARQQWQETYYIDITTIYVTMYKSGYKNDRSEWVYFNKTKNIKELAKIIIKKIKEYEGIVEIF